MRLISLILALVSANLMAADQPGTAAAPSNLPGVYRQFTPPPTAVPTPVPSGIGTVRYVVHKDTMALALRGGAAVPLGDLSKYAQTGYSAGLGLIYGASNLIDVAFELDYAAMPYKLTVSAQPMTSTGIGVKAILKALSDQKLGVYFDGGMGYYFVNVAVDVDKGPSPLNPAIRLTEPGYKSSGGMGFNLGMIINYQFTPNFAASLSADATQISLSGGTSDTPLFLTPSLNIAYTF